MVIFAIASSKTDVENWFDFSKGLFDRVFLKALDEVCASCVGGGFMTDAPADCTGAEKSC